MISFSNAYIRCALAPPISRSRFTSRSHCCGASRSTLARFAWYIPSLGFYFTHVSAHPTTRLFFPQSLPSPSGCPSSSGSAGACFIRHMGLRILAGLLHFGFLHPLFSSSTEYVCYGICTRLFLHPQRRISTNRLATDSGLLYYVRTG